MPGAIAAVIRDGMARSRARDAAAGRSLYGPMRGEGTALEMITPTPVERLSLIPSEEDLGALEIELASALSPFGYTQLLWISLAGSFCRCAHRAINAL